MEATIGCIVIYKTTEEDKAYFEELGNSPDELPAVIVRVHDNNVVNLKVFGDAGDDLWATSINQGNGVGEWNWPEIKK